MSSLPKCVQNPRLQLVRVTGLGYLVTIETLGKQHYLVWQDGVPITEVQCVPKDSHRWYSIDDGLKYSSTRMQAIISGYFAIRKLQEGVPRKWSDKARAAITQTRGEAAA